MSKIYILLSGGLVQSVYAPEGMTAFVIDEDNAECDETVEIDNIELLNQLNVDECSRWLSTQS